ncbi:MAG TPA: extracellular solute-binding protein [Opitutaceae bacterium]|nr:extracellular solute-binding protein [Opitutaceae bacterium]
MSAPSIILKGVTWDHTRGYLPMVATAQRFQELHRDVAIVWEKRSLLDFEEFPIEQLAAQYDLLVIDHPFVGYAAAHGPLLPLDEHLAENFLRGQAENSVGASHSSYAFAGHHWALAIDAATPVAFWREDLLQRHGLSVPRTWEELLVLARSGHVELPAAPINCLMNFYMLCVELGEMPFRDPAQVVSPAVGTEAARLLAELIAACAPGCRARNPIASHDLVASRANETIVYCPFAYGYSNYARAGYADHCLTFGELPRLNDQALCSTLGGTGLALSALRPRQPAALAYAEFVASAEVQRTLYTHAGGQPAHRAAWTDAENNRLTRNYFTSTLPVLDRAYVRPRFSGYLDFQKAAGPLLHAALLGDNSIPAALRQIDQLYQSVCRENSVLS